MACLPCELARLKKLGKMAKKRKSSKRGGTRRRRIGALGKLSNRSLTLQLNDLLFLAGGAALNYIVVNPLLNKLTGSLQKADGTPMLGKYQGEILTAIKGGAAAWAAYSTKLPKEVKLALLGVTAASGVELVGQLLPDKMIALQGTGDLFMAGVGNTQLIEIPMRRRVAGGMYDGVSVAGNGLTDDQIVTAGMGDLYDTEDDFPY